MDWGNAFVRSKTLGSSGEVTAITMELNLEGDFRKTKKKVTWLASPSQASSAGRALIPTILLDYDYLISKKKLEEGDELADYVTPVTEFRVAALADANVSDLQKGDIIQFERKGYYIFDGEVDGHKEFIRIPDGRAAGLASKATPAEETEKPKAAKAAKGPKAKPAAKAGKQTPQSKTHTPSSEELKMYKVAEVYGENPPKAVDLKMYDVKNVYEVA